MGDKNKKTVAQTNDDWSDLPVVKTGTQTKSPSSDEWGDLPVIKSTELATTKQEEPATEPVEETVTIEQPQYLKPPVPVLPTQPEFFNPDVTQMKPTGVVNKKLPYSNKLEKRTPRTAEQIAQDRDNAFSVLANDYAMSGMQMPGYAQPAKTQFIDPVHPINKITAPTGNPEYTAGYRNTRVAELRKKLHDAAIYESGSEIELKPVIEKKIKEIDDATSKVIDLQLFNREYSQKKYTPEKAQTMLAANQTRFLKEKEAYQKKVDEIFKKYPQASRNQDNLIDTRATDAINKLKDDFRFQEQEFNKTQQSIINNSKYDKTMLGAEKESLLGSAQAKKDLADMRAGRPINPESKYRYEQIGWDIINEGLESTVNENVKKEVEPYADRDAKQLKKNNREFIKEKAKEDIGNMKYRDETKTNMVLNTIIPSVLRPDITDDQIKKYANDLGVDGDVAEDLIKEKETIPKEISVWQQFGKGYADFLAPALYERAVRTVAFSQGKNVDEMFPPGWQDQRGIMSKLAGNAPTEQNSIHNVRGVLGAMANTYGMLRSFGPFAKMVAEPIAAAGKDLAIGAELLKGTTPIAKYALEPAVKLGTTAATSSEGLANFGIMFFEGYNGAYQQAKDIVGDKPEDEWRRQLYSMTSGGISALLFSAHPQSKYATLNNELNKTGKQFLDEIKNTGMKGILSPKVVSKFANHIGEMAKMEGLVISQAGLNKIAQNTLYNIAKPGEDQDVKLTEGLGEDMMHTALTFLVPSVMSGYGIAKQKTPLNKAAIFDIGTHAKSYTDWVYKQQTEGKMTGAQVSQLVGDIRKIENIMAEVSVVNDNGQNLTPNQIKDYTFSLLQEQVLQQKLDNLSRAAEARKMPVDKAQEAPLKKQISELVSEREKILKEAGKPAPAPTQEPPIIPENKDDMLPVEDVVVEPENKSEQNLESSGEKDITLQNDIESNEIESQPKTKENEEIIKLGEQENVSGQVSANDSKSTEVGPDTEIRGSTDGKGRDVQQESGPLEPSKETKENVQRESTTGTPAEPVSEKPAAEPAKKKRRMFVEEEETVVTPEPVVEEVVEVKDVTPEIVPVEPTPTPKEPITETVAELQAKLDKELARPEPATTKAQKAKAKRIEDLKKRIEDASTQSQEQQQKGDTESGVQEPEGVEQARSEAETPSPESGDSVQRGKTKPKKEKVDNTPFGEAKSKANKRPKPRNEYQRLKQIATSGDPSSFYEAVLQAIVNGIRFSYDDIRNEFGIKHSDMKEYFRRVAKKGWSVDHFVESFLKSDDDLYNPLGFISDAIEGRREFFEVWQRYGSDERAALQELLRIQGKNEQGEDIMPSYSGEPVKAESGPSREELWAKLTPEQRNKYWESEGEMDLQDLVEDVVDAVEMTDAEAQIILDYAETLTEEGEINLTKPDLFDRDYQDAYDKLEALGKGKGKLLEFMITGDIADRYKQYDKIFEEYGIEKTTDTPEGAEPISSQGEGVPEDGKPSSEGEGGEQPKGQSTPEKAIESKYDKVADKIEQELEAYLKRSADVSKGMMQGGLTGGFSTRVGDKIVTAVAKAAIALVRAGKNVHIAIYKAIEAVKAENPEETKDLRFDDIDNFNRILNIKAENPKTLPELTKTNREIADEWVSDIRKGELTYGEAVAEVMQVPGLKDATKENILNYMNYRLHREAAHTLPNGSPREGNVVAETQFDKSEASQFLGEQTEKDIWGEEGFLDEEGEVKTALRLQTVMQEARNLANVYQQKIGGLATKWGARMFADIKEVTNDPVKQGAALAGLKVELQAARIRNDADLKKIADELPKTSNPELRAKMEEARANILEEQQRLRALIAQVQNYSKKLASTASDVLNTRRLDRMMRDDVLAEHYQDKMLTEQQAREKRATEKALVDDIMEDYKNHPQYKEEMSIKKEKARSQARARREKKKAEEASGVKAVVSKVKEKVADIAESITGNRKKEAEKKKQEAINNFPLNEKGQRMSPAEFLEYIKKLKKPC